MGVIWCIVYFIAVRPFPLSICVVIASIVPTVQAKALFPVTVWGVEASEWLTVCDIDSAVSAVNLSNIWCIIKGLSPCFSVLLFRSLDTYRNRWACFTVSCLDFRGKFNGIFPTVPRNFDSTIKMSIYLGNFFLGFPMRISKCRSLLFFSDDDANHHGRSQR